MPAAVAISVRSDLKQCRLCRTACFHLSDTRFLLLSFSCCHTTLIFKFPPTKRKTGLLIYVSGSLFARPATAKQRCRDLRSSCAHVIAYLPWIQYKCGKPVLCQDCDEDTREEGTFSARLVYQYGRTPSSRGAWSRSGEQVDGYVKFLTCTFLLI